MLTEFFSESMTHTFKESPKKFLECAMQFKVPLGCEENNHKWIFFILKEIYKGIFSVKMEIINLGRLVFEDVNGPEGHLCSLNFFLKA